MPFRVGEIVGDYEILGGLGRGGMGAVYRVRNRFSQRVEALKELLPEVSPTGGPAERFLREIRVHAGLQHPRIAQLFTAFRWEDRLLMVMELVEGENLESLLRRGPVAPGDAAGIGSQVLEALEYAHGRGVVHRDIKPSNIAVLPAGGVKLLDFGIARGREDGRITSSGMVVGSPAYMSPEQVAGQAVDGRSDLYSLGLTLYEAATGVQPIRGESHYAIIQAQVSHTPEPPGAVDACIPPALSGAIMRALEKDPARRFQTAAEFRQALAPFCREETLTIQPPQAAAARPGADSAALDTLARSLARYVGPIARRLVDTHSRTAASAEELHRELAAEIPSAADRAAFLESCRGGTTTASASPGAAIDTATLDRAARELAAYVGPLARVIAGRAARKARTEVEFLDALGREIEDAAGRRRFLDALRRPGTR